MCPAWAPASGQSQGFPAPVAASLCPSCPHWRQPGTGTSPAVGLGAAFTTARSVPSSFLNTEKELGWEPLRDSGREASEVAGEQRQERGREGRGPTAPLRVQHARPRLGPAGQDPAAAGRRSGRDREGRAQGQGATGTGRKSSPLPHMSTRPPRRISEAPAPSAHTHREAQLPSPRDRGAGPLGRPTGPRAGHWLRSRLKTRPQGARGGAVPTVPWDGGGRAPGRWTWDRLLAGPLGEWVEPGAGPGWTAHLGARRRRGEQAGRRRAGFAGTEGWMSPPQRRVGAGPPWGRGSQVRRGSSSEVRSGEHGQRLGVWVQDPLSGRCQGGK